MKSKANLTIFLGVIAIAFSSEASAKSDLICNFDNYKIASGARLPVVKSFIPEQQTHTINSQKTTHNGFVLEGVVTKDNLKELFFEYEFLNQDTNILLKYKFFRTTKKIAAFMKPTGYSDIGPVWGFCNELTNNTEAKDIYGRASSTEICNEVVVFFGSDTSATVAITDETGETLNQGWLDEAEKRWGKDFIQYCASKLNSSVEEKSETPNSFNNAINEAKNVCEEIGFKPKTEKFGECVLKLIDN